MTIKAPKGTMNLLQIRPTAGQLWQEVITDWQCLAIRTFMEEHNEHRCNSVGGSR